MILYREGDVAMTGGRPVRVLSAENDTVRVKYLDGFKPRSTPTVERTLLRPLTLDLHRRYGAAT